MNRFGAAALAATLVAAGATLYVTKDTPLTTPGGAAIGTVLPGSALAAAPSSAGMSRVTIDGWEPKSETSVVYQDVDSQVALVRFEAAGSSGATIVATKTDAYGAVWNEVRVEGEVPSAALTANPDEVWNTAEKLYGQRCSACHTLHQTDEFTANQWPGILASMGSRAALSGAQQDLILRYLQAHARVQ